jgi:hypothetical protein
MTVNTKALNPSKVTAEPIVSKGAKFQKHLKIYLDEVYVPAMANNPTRKDGKDPDNVNDLTQSLSKNIRYHLMPPVVRKKQIFANGKRYDYELIAGNHRFEALRNNKYSEWIFSLYEFGLDGTSEESSIIRFQLKENDHPPQLNASVEDVANSVVGEISRGSNEVVNTEYSIRDYVDSVCQNSKPQTKNAIVKRVMQSLGTYQDVVTYTADDVKRWAEEEGYVVGGKLDRKRDECGWSVLDTRYINEFKTNAILKLAETDKESYFLYHTLAPTESQNLNAKRSAMIKYSDNSDAAYFKFAEFVTKNKRMPWHAIGFLPQDRKANETDLIKIG